MASHGDRPRYPYGESVTLAELELTREQLAVEAVASAHDGIRALEQLGLDPVEALRQRAAGDPDRVAAFVAACRPPGAENAVAIVGAVAVRP